MQERYKRRSLRREHHVIRIFRNSFHKNLQTQAPPLGRTKPAKQYEQAPNQQQEQSTHANMRLKADRITLLRSPSPATVAQSPKQPCTLCANPKLLRCFTRRRQRKKWVHHVYSKHSVRYECIQMLVCGLSNPQAKPAAYTPMELPPSHPNSMRDRYLPRICSTLRHGPDTEKRRSSDGFILEGKPSRRVSCVSSRAHDVHRSDGSSAAHSDSSWPHRSLE